MSAAGRRRTLDSSVCWKYVVLFYVFVRDQFDFPSSLYYLLQLYLVSAFLKEAIVPSISVQIRSPLLQSGWDED